MLYDIFVQLFGIFGILAAVISFQCKKHKRMLFLRTVAEFMFGVQLLLLGAYTGMAMDFIGCVRNMVFSKLIEKGKKTGLMQVVFSVVLVVFIIFTWEGNKSILSGAAKVLSTIAYGNTNINFVRIMILITCTSWLIYNYMVKSYAGCVCELLTICSIIAGVIRIEILNKRKIAKKD